MRDRCIFREMPPSILHLNLDDAWPGHDLGLTTLDLRAWGPRLRFSAPAREMEAFARALPRPLPPFLVYGSGDFHHLSALWLRRLERPAVVISFDNHPDWDVRPPRWACGGWVNRALELPLVEKVSVWGCGNFECWWPGQLFGNRTAERAGRLEVHPWSDEENARRQKRRGAIRRNNWRERFAAFVQELRVDVYVTIDLDCLCAEEAVTNWENGRYTVADLVWALQLLGERIRAGDICGAWSEPHYARRKQRFAAEWDRPKLLPPAPARARTTNERALRALLPALTGVFP